MTEAVCDKNFGNKTLAIGALVVTLWTCYGVL